MPIEIFQREQLFNVLLFYFNKNLHPTPQIQ